MLSVAVALLLFLPLVLALLGGWVCIEVLFWAFVTSPHARHAAELNAQPAEGHWPQNEDQNRAFQRFIKVTQHCCCLLQLLMLAVARCKACGSSST